MPKTLVVLRHAKSAWPDGVADHDRPLSGRGRRDAPAVGRWLCDQKVAVELALVSSARRTVETADLVDAELRSPPRRVVSEDVYHAGAGDLLDRIRELPDDVSTAMVVGHNPSVGMLASVLDDSSGGLLEFKTSAVAVFEIGDRWAEANAGGARLVASAVPRG
jgi:phosphohistidine phosphatase